MKSILKVYGFIQDFFSFLTGGTECISCGIRTLSVPLCRNCQTELLNFVPFDNDRRCSRCGKVLISEIGVCRECSESKAERFLDGMFPVHMYRLWKKDLMFAWKSQGTRTLSPFFASIINKVILNLTENKKIEFDYIVPVPPRPGKMRKVGWDQVDELCHYLQKFYGYEIFYPLERISSREQKTLNKEQRKGNLGAVYRLKEKFNLQGRKFLILDDVCTTGATLDKCSRLLKSAGAEEVYGISLFLVD
ncbi:MAG: ComF family protein [Treponema sp.]|nr:ComF family protein [Candidatus Treponema merdequi]